MILPDINVLIYAHREDHPRHDVYRAWLETALERPEGVALSTMVLTGFLRIMTDSRILPRPMALEVALEAVDSLRKGERCMLLEPGALHWETLDFLCRKANLKGSEVSDASLAALAIEHGCELVTADRGFSRFAGLRWRLL